MKKWLLMALFIYLSILSFLWLDAKTSFQDPKLTIGGKGIPYLEHVAKEQTILPFLLRSFYENERGELRTISYENSDLELSSQVSSLALMKIERSGKLVYDGTFTSNIGLLLEEDGIYDVTITEEKQLNFYSKKTHTYRFRLAVKKGIHTVLHNEEVKKGSFVLLNVSSMKQSDSIHIESNLSKKIGGQYDAEGTMYVYFPISVDTKVGTYSIDLYNHGEKIKSYTVKVLEEEEKNPIKKLDGNIETAILRFEESMTSVFDTSLEERLWDISFPWPLVGDVTSVYFDTYLNQKKQYFHQGIDIVGTNDMPVKSVLNGKVVYAGTTDLLGNFVVVDHGHFLYTCYGHLKVLMVKEGDPVQKQTTILGQLGEKPLHFAVRMKDVYLDPFAFLKK